MRHAGTLCWLVVGLLVLNVAAPGVALADDEKANEPVMIGGSYATQPLNYDSRSDDDDGANEPVMVGGSYASEPFDFDSRGLDEVLPPIPTEILDPPFDRYLDLELLRRAWEDLDPAMLADVALQLAEGERVLLRSHKAFRAEDVLSLAITAAAESRDTDTLERLTKAVARSDNADLKAQIDAVAKLASEPRAIDPAMMLPVEKTSVEEFAVLRRLLRALRAARIAGNRRALDDIQEALEGGLELPEMPRDYLLKMTTEARSALPEEEEPAAMANALEKLGGGSRFRIRIPNPSDMINRNLSQLSVPCPKCGGTGRIPHWLQSGSRSARYEGTAVEIVDESQLIDGMGLGLVDDRSDAPTVTDPLPDDPAFDRYLPVSDLLLAWETPDSLKLADLAIQATEGKRILMRDRHGVPASLLWEAAVRAAELQSDVAALQRLADAAERFGKDDLTERVRAGIVLAGVARADDTVTVDPLAHSVEDFAVLQEYSRSITRAALRGDMRFLQDFAQNVELLLPESSQFRDIIRVLLDRAQSYAPPSQPDAEALAQVDQLLAESRWKLPKVSIKPPKVKLPVNPGKVFDKAKETVQHVTGKGQEAITHTGKKIEEAGTHVVDKTKEALAHEIMSITAEWQYQLWVPDPAYRVNFNIQNMYYDTSSRLLHFRVNGSAPLRATGRASTRLASVSVRVSGVVDYDMDVGVQFSVEEARLTAQPRVTNVNARVRDLQFNADLVNWFRRRIQAGINKKIQESKPDIQRHVENAVSQLNRSYDLRQLAEAIRSRLPAAQAGVFGLRGSAPGSIMGTWQTEGRRVTFDGNTATIRTADGGQALFRYAFDPSSGVMIGIDASGQRTQTSIRWLSPNAIEWTSPTGRRQYVRVGAPSVAAPRLTARIDLQEVGHAAGGVIQAHLIHFLSNWRLSDSGRETLRLRAGEAAAIFAGGQVLGAW